MKKNNEIENLIQKRDALDERIKDEKLKLLENFTLEFLNYFEKDIDDLQSTKKGCREFIDNLVKPKQVEQSKFESNFNNEY